MQVLQLGTRLDADLFDQRSPGCAVRLERLGLAPAAVERQHLQAAQALAQRVLGDQRLELRGDGRVAAERELRRDPVLERRDPELVETGGLGLRKRLERQVGERRATPERQSLAEQLRGTLGLVAAERPLALGEQALEPRQIEVLVLDPELVAARPW